MTDFLIKSTLAMGVLLGLYYILFEREKMHRFNRFYLLSALVFSLALPFITIVTYIQEIPTSTQTITVNSAPPTFQPVTEQPIDYLFYIGWTVYTIITFILIIRFTINIISFFKRANRNPSPSMGKAKLVLLEEKVLPHTFLNYIFVNREEYEAKLIENELYTHEYTHVKQKHTLDILFIEALKTLFWFNPLLYFYKKAIQLNHEFLADEKVIDSTANTVYYQKLLLEKATVGTTFSMASNLTFSLTKKRLIMMTKTTSSTKAGFIKLALAPVVTALLMMLCTKTIAQEKLSDIPADKIKTITVNKNLTPRQADSLRKANPKVYKSKDSASYTQTTVSYTNENGKVATKSFFDTDTISQKKEKLSSHIQRAIFDIPAHKIKNMTITKNVTQKQVDSLKIAIPKIYASNNPGDYGKMVIEYTDESGNPSSKTAFIEQ
jgi:hypothetical protein